MEIGGCVAPAQFPALAAAGADYAELAVARDVMGGDEAAFGRLLALVGASPVRVAAFNVLLPGDLAVVGPAVDRARLDAYIATAFGRIARLSPGAVVVFGSGRSRSVPDGFPRDAALGQLAEFLGWVGPAASAHGLALALEPLRRAESNVFNTLAEGAAFIAARGLRDVALLADLFHMEEEGEGLGAVATHGALIAHAHTADTGRRAPGTGDYPQVAFFAALRAHTGCRRCSIECSWGDFDREIGPAVAALRRAAGDAG